MGASEQVLMGDAIEGDGVVWMWIGDPTVIVRTRVRDGESPKDAAKRMIVAVSNGVMTAVLAFTASAP